MEKIYFDIEHPASFAGVEKLQKSSKKSRKEVEDFLAGVDEYTQYKQIRRKFPRRKILAYHAHELYQVDLADFSKLAKYNNGYRYVLVAIDTLSKYVFYIPIKNKTPVSIIRAFREIFKKHKPKMLMSDRGREFTAKAVQKFFCLNKVHWYSVFSEIKASAAERQIRTLREKLRRIMHHSGQLKYTNILSKLAATYNKTVHSRTGYKPSEINSKNENSVFQKLYGTPVSSKKIRYKIGEQVRVSRALDLFEKKSSVRRWSEEVFTVYKIRLSNPPMYYLKDHKGEELLGGFYAFELARVQKNERSFWDIEKIIRKRKNKDGTLEYLVKFRGYKGNYWTQDIYKK